MVPGDIWDFDSVQQMILADLTINGRPRKVIMQANKNGFYYVIDRAHRASSSRRSRSRTSPGPRGSIRRPGRPIVNPEAYYGTEPISISPGGGGAHNWSPMSFNPHDGSGLHPHVDREQLDLCGGADFTTRKPGQMTGTVRPLPAATRPPPPAIGPEPLGEQGNRGALVAWDPVTQQMRWRMPGGGGIGGGTLTTAGNLVFQVINDGRLMAYSADKGEKLLEMQTGLRSGMGPPITYQLDGKQYVALMGGVGAASPAGTPAPAIRRRRFRRSCSRSSLAAPRRSSP